MSSGMLTLGVMMVVRKDGSERRARVSKQNGLEDAVVERKHYEYLNIQLK